MPLNIFPQSLKDLNGREEGEGGQCVRGLKEGLGRASRDLPELSRMKDKNGKQLV